MKVSRKKHILILFAIGLVYFVGVAAIIYPIAGNMYSINSSKTVINSYAKKVEKMTDEEIEKRFQNAQKYNEDIAKEIYDDGYERSLNFDDGLMCYVEIPKQEIYLPVYYGTSSEVLLKGCGWLERTSLPIGGPSTHASISGHTGLPNAEMFSKLDSCSLGDLFYIHVLDRTLVYQVDRIETVSPNDIKHLLVIEGEDHLTLITCTPYGINDKRLLVRGVRVSDETDIADGSETIGQRTNISEAAQRANDALQKQIDQSMTVIIIIVAAAVIIFAGACVWLSRVVMFRSVKPKYARKKRSEVDNGKAEK